MDARAVESARAPTLLDIVKSWLLCGWITQKTFLKPGYMEVVSRATSAAASEGNSSAKPYVSPSRWTQLVRKCRARFRRSNCYVQQSQSDHDYYYKMESYQRNFDGGREFWEDLPIIGHPLEDPWSPQGFPVNNSSAPVPDPVWMITASQQEMKEKAAAIVRAKRGEY